MVDAARLRLLFAAAAALTVLAVVGAAPDGAAWLPHAYRRLQDAAAPLFTVDPVTGHKAFAPNDRSDYLGVGAAIVGLMIAAGGGIGGGGMLVPIYVLVLGFKPKFAIPLSNMTVLGGAITNVGMNARKRHPLANRSLVDWDLLILMEPLTLAGALVGGFVNKLAPEIVITVLLVVLLYATSERTLKKGMKLYDKETAAMEASAGAKEMAEITEAERAEAAKAEAAGLLDDAEAGNDGGVGDAPPKADATKTPELLAIEAEEMESFPAWKVGVLLGMFALTVSMNLAKGGGAFPSPFGIECGTSSYWAVTFFMFAALIVIALWVRSYLVERTKQKDACGYAYVDGDFHWDETTTLKYPSICFFAGVCAGLFGIGGGIVNGPLMLELGVLPPVAGATTACMILLTSTTAATTFLTFGLVQFDYAKRLFVVGILATAVGQLGMGHLIKKTGRSSYVAFSIGAVVSLSTVLMGFHGVVSLAYPDPTEAGNTGGICGSG